MNKFYAEQISNCDRRRLDMERIRKYLIQQGFSETTQLGEASHVIAVTCSTTDANIADSVTMLSKLNQSSPKDSRIIVVGCLDKKHSADLEKVVLHLNPKDGLMPLQKTLGFEESPYSLPDVILPTPNIMNVRVQEGCLGTCSYCDIRTKIGKAHSRDISAIIGDVEGGLTGDVELIRLTGDDVGTYGVNNATSFRTLLEAVSAAAPGRKLMIDNLDPKYLVKEWDVINEFARQSLVFHAKIPVQHFDSRVLSLMNRFSDIGLLSEKIDALGGYDVQLQTHFIVGFPTETREELFSAAEKVVALPFGQVSFIPYANKDKAPSSRMEQQSKDEVKYRMQQLKRLVSGAGLVEVPYVDSLGIEEIKLVKEGYKNATRRYQ